MSYFTQKSPPRKEYNVYPKSTQQQDLINLILKSQMQRNAYLNQSSHYRQNTLTEQHYVPLKPQNVYSKSPIKTETGSYQNIYSGSPQRWNTSSNTRYSPTYFRKKYNKYDNKESILLQILRPEQPQIPEKINDQLNNSTLREFQDFLSSQIYKHIILNNNKYKRESKNHYTSIDVSNYRLSLEQKSNQDLKKSICVMLSHYMEFIVSIMDYLKTMIDSEFNSLKQSKQGDYQFIPNNEPIQYNSNEDSKQFIPHSKQSGYNSVNYNSENVEEPPQSQFQQNQEDNSNHADSTFSFQQQQQENMAEKAKQYAMNVGKKQNNNPLDFKSGGLQKKVKERKNEEPEQDYHRLSKIIPLQQQVSNSAKDYANNFLKLIYQQGISRADRVYRERQQDQNRVQNEFPKLKAQINVPSDDDDDY